MIRRFKHIVISFAAVGLLSCNKPLEGSVHAAQKSENWLFGQWATYTDDGFDLTKACERPDSQFGKQYLYWRDEVEGDLDEELNKVDEYRIEGGLVKAHVSTQTSRSAYVQKDGFMYFEKVAENVVKMVDWKYPNRSPLLFKCPSSPIPYSADVAPTPPKYDNIEPGIIDRPRS
ncbi:hypothetical protein NQT62_13245 [Limnobacter humi]|uniref:Lipoprotein n=1 Tax=Limnobacter humi TaxID=1778671 RepID=A0ABT1WIQ4_9BURK|nr:hypothetical protein [Limnobacter humi]MCQ8897401.1 hypothetical protein [Limnobacter humi]